MRNLASLAPLAVLVLVAPGIMTAYGDSALAKDSRASNWDLSGWHLCWSDEFDGSTLNPSNWTADIGDGSPQIPGWGNAESQYYTARPENLSIVQDGSIRVLRIRAMSERHQGKYYTSARITTEGKRSFQFGRVEARIKLPQGKGLWPAFWMMGDSFSTVGWPACGEIDIVEMRGGDDGTISGTMHWKNAEGNLSSSIPGVARLDSGVFADRYHLFGIEWNDKTIGWYLDGKQYVSQTLDDPEREEFRNGKFFILINLAVGGSFLGNQIPQIGFKEESMYVDWVRWYKKD